ncbi:MAG: ribosome-associated translation inhibitor RaiA [Pirellulales bacterium]
MQINISTRHGHLSEATREKISAKVEKLARLYDRLTAIDVRVDLEHEDKPGVDIRVSAEHKHDFQATDTCENLLAAVDNAMHKLEQQLRKYKEKVQEHHRGSTHKEIVPPDEE